MSGTPMQPLSSAPESRSRSSVNGSATPNPTITMTTYQHVLPGDDEQAALIGARTILGS